MTTSQRTHRPVTSAEPLESGTRSSHATTPRRGRAGREDGAAAVEFAIVATLFFMLVFGIIDFGFAFHSWNNAANAAREGARKGAVDPDPQHVRDRALASAQTLDLTKVTVDVTCSHDGLSFSSGLCGASLVEGDIVRVTVNYAYDMITPIGSFVPGLGPTLDLHSESESRFEGQ